jgi:N-methylhydantoinase A
MIEEGTIAYSPEYEVGASLSAGNRLVGGGGELIRAPSIDIAEIGAGGGSVAYLDRAGGLHVGPRSMGAMPGPACYGRGGTTPTVTDANVVLGYIRPGKLADGAVSINVEAARRAIHDHIAVPMRMGLLEAAMGIHHIANARMMRVLRAVSTERGRDPRDFAMMAFGGSGPIHAAGLAKELYIGRTIIPPMPGLFSALGLLFSGVEHHDVRSCSLAGGQLTPLAIDQLRAEMETKMLGQFRAEGFAASDVALAYSVDTRFQGQASEVAIPLRLNDAAEIDAATLKRLQEMFEAEHLRLYGHLSEPDIPLEVSALRLVGQAILGGEHSNGQLLKPAASRGAASATSQATKRQAYFGVEVGSLDTPVVTRQAITGMMAGPLLIDEYDATTVVPPDTQVSLDEQGNLILQPIG